MVRIIMNGCNGHMGQVISDLVSKDENAEIVAGVDLQDTGRYSYPVFTELGACDVKADVMIDFSSAKATDAVWNTAAAGSFLWYCVLQDYLRSSYKK